ncbi:MAG: ABC transporter ATP-binding protein [Magnetospirillum sp.]|nr:ABC transporter ATP-binding protein [Magnetospirillum sp.]
MTEAVMLEGVVKRFGTTMAVAGVTLSVTFGERLALLGHNGAGKTTLMKLMLGLATPSAGSVRVLGEVPPARQPVGFLPEAVAFPEAMTGAELIAFYARLKRRPPAEGRVLLRRVGLDGAAGRRVATYSKGMRQRLGLAQALLGQPRLLLLDEPTGGLDPEVRAAFYDILGERVESGAAVILSSHLLAELETRTDRIAILDRGRLVALGTVDALRARAGLPVTVRVRLKDGTARTDVVPAADKLATLRRLLALDPLDLTVAEPGLDALYAHFVAVAPCPPC